ncbi:molybdenum cofactor cytidylyltransferase [Senegalia massiliensis]|uniref:Molybdenum cofactor cytidylyltransferase n=1 Tax=Senegalia massiliensis TaxID=1720316 RepID=A0A845R059_9CLOT|nr:molybdenum cofactor cytidylyltransferase [Senegalia massiliensis]NBI05983.1 molybdenum cofactor cytidylyltransferase [Senegalia massiliensis]
MITAIIMASGFSERMGSDKLFLKVNSQTLIERTIKIVKGSKIDNIIIVYRDKRIKDIAKNQGIISIYNNNAKKGQSESIKLGIKSADERTKGFIFFVGDQPFLSIGVINKIITEFKKRREEIIIPLYNGKRGNPIIFPALLKKELLLINGDIGGREVIKNNLDIVNYIKIHDKYLGIDIDTIEDYKKIIDRGE